MDSCKTCKLKYEGKGLKTCKSCSEVAYCSVECQEKDWPAHKNECKSLRRAQLPRLFIDLMNNDNKRNARNFFLRLSKVCRL